MRYAYLIIPLLPGLEHNLEHPFYPIDYSIPFKIVKRRKIRFWSVGTPDSDLITFLIEGTFEKYFSNENLITFQWVFSKHVSYVLSVAELHFAAKSN